MDQTVDLDAYYAAYPFQNQQPNYFYNRWFKVLLRRLEKSGLHRGHSVLDYGCGNGLFVRFLRTQDYSDVTGYDPYVEAYSDPEALARQYDVVVSLDVLEHVEAPSDLIDRYRDLLKPAGLLCLRTPRADGIDLSQPEEYVHALHMPYHLHIYSEKALLDACLQAGLVPVEHFRRYYMDDWSPATSRRFIDAFMWAHGNDLDVAFEPPDSKIILRTPSLWFLALFGYLLPLDKEDDMMLMLRCNPNESRDNPERH